MTMSCVAEEKPSSTAASAICDSAPGRAGSISAIRQMAAMTPHCASSSQARRRPNVRVKSGSGRASASGDQTNLKE